MGWLCPICLAGTMVFVLSWLGSKGQDVEQFKCDNEECGHVETKVTT